MLKLVHYNKKETASPNFALSSQIHGFRIISQKQPSLRLDFGHTWTIRTGQKPTWTLCGKRRTMVHLGQILKPRQPGRNPRGRPTDRANPSFTGAENPNSLTPGHTPTQIAHTTDGNSGPKGPPHRAPTETRGYDSRRDRRPTNAAYKVSGNINETHICRGRQKPPPVSSLEPRKPQSYNENTQNRRHFATTFRQRTKHQKGGGGPQTSRNGENTEVRTHQQARTRHQTEQYEDTGTTTRTKVQPESHS